MVTEAARDVEMCGRKRELDAQAGVAMPGLSFDVVVAHILREEHLPDPADLAILRAVSRGMRDAVDATGRKVEVLGERQAAIRGYHSTLKCLRRRGELEDECLLCAAAARNGDLEVLKALRAEDSPWNEKTCACAAERGHLEVLKWARENGCPWDERTCRYAAERGHLEVLKWAVANDCPWDERTCSAAAKGGPLEVLKWARENGCPWDEDTRLLAASLGYVET